MLLWMLIFDRVSVRRLAACGTLSAALLVMPNLAASDDGSARDRARVEVSIGAKLHEAGDAPAALHHFERGFRIFPSAKIHYNVALAYQSMGKLAPALVAFERFLREEGSGDLRDRHEHARMRAKALSRQVGFVEISCDAGDAEGYLDGASIGPLTPPARLPVDVGDHQILIRSLALGSRSRTFSAAAGRTITLTFTLDQGSAAMDPGKEREAEQLVRQGVELRKQRKHLEAYDLFRRAHELHPSPRSTAQLGLVEYQLGRWVDAEGHLERASQADDTWIEQNRATIVAALETVRSHVAYIEVKGTPPGAEVTVNGRAVGKLPVAGLIKTGEGYAEVTVSAPGYVSAHRTLAVQAQLTQQLFVTLLPLNGRNPSGGSDAPTGQSASLSWEPAHAEVTSGPAGNSKMRVAGLALGLVGLVGIGYGGFQSYRVEVLSTEVARTDPSGVSRGRIAQERQWWGYGVGALAAGAGGLLYWLGRNHPASPPVSLSVLPTPGLLLFSLHVPR